MKFHYVYRITNKLTHMHYYGSRTAKIPPNEDLGIKYLSSSSDADFIADQKTNSQNYRYKIVKLFETREAALAFEIKLHEMFEVGKNPKFYNLAKQTSKGFDTTGVKHSEEWCKNHSKALKGRPSPKKGTQQTEEAKRKNSESNKGKIISQEQRIKISQANTGRSRPDLSESNKKKAKPIKCDGITFESGLDAAKHFNISASTVVQRIKSKRFDWHYV